MIKTLSQDYSSLGLKRSIAALVPSFVIAQTAVFLGVPVSFHKIIVSVIIGSDYTGKDTPVSVQKCGTQRWRGSRHSVSRASLATSPCQL